MNAAFYGETEHQEYRRVFAALAVTVGSSQCALELSEACDYVEQVCGPLVSMPTDDELSRILMWNH